MREYARTAVGSQRPHLDLDSYRADPLAPQTVELVGYLARLERSTMATLRTMLVTPTHTDARVTAFLVTWAYEKFWIADALEAVLEAHPHHRVVPPARQRGLRALRADLGTRFAPVRESVVANAIGTDVVAWHTSAGVVDEWTVSAAYGALSERAEHLELSRMLASLLEVKQRHEGFFAAQSRDRLARSSRAVALVRRRLMRQAWPIGADAETPAATSRFFELLHGAGAVEPIDARIDELPGLDGLHLLRRVADRSLAGRPPTPRGSPGSIP